MKIFSVTVSDVSEGPARDALIASGLGLGDTIFKGYVPGESAALVAAIGKWWDDSSLDEREIALASAGIESDEMERWFRALAADTVASLVEFAGRDASFRRVIGAPRG